jgi:hypothetical protein
MRPGTQGWEAVDIADTKRTPGVEIPQDWICSISHIAVFVTQRRLSLQFLLFTSSSKPLGLLEEAQTDVVICNVDAR